MYTQIKYHADFEKMKGTKITVVDDPETMRIKQNTAIQSNVEYHKVRDQLSEMEQKRPDQEARGRTRTSSLLTGPRHCCVVTRHRVHCVIPHLQCQLRLNDLIFVIR